MKYVRLTAADEGLAAARWRWVLFAEFDKRYGFVPTQWDDDSDPWTHTVLAVDELGLAGAFRYTRHPDADELIAGGTWVRPDQRGKGIAQELWKRGLRGVRWVSVTTISAGGRGLVKRMKATFPKITFNANK